MAVENGNYLRVIKRLEYHFNKMQEKIQSFNLEEFEFELSSFIEASRNITFAMQKEFSKNPKFNEWYSRKQIEMSEDPILSFFKTKRNKVVKEGEKGSAGFKISLDFEYMFKEETTVNGVSIPSDIFVNPNSRALVRTVDGRDLPMDRKDLKFIPLFSDLDKRPVMDVCKECLEKFKKISEELQSIIQKQNIV